VPRRTNLVDGEATVEMVEHVMAALAGLQIDNCLVRTNRAEMPGCDGSSRAFVDSLMAAGRRVQSADRPLLKVTRPVRVGDDQCWVEAQPASRGELVLRYTLDYGAGPIGQQTIELAVTPQRFRDQLSGARTFVLQEEAEWMRQQGLGLRVTWRDLLVFGPQGPIDNRLRYPDECVRHKALDMVGDLALAGCDIQGRIVAYRSGHRLNAQLVRTLLANERIMGNPRSAA
jgi:UDP-3-O-acyl N-acetylglucosamine deacetylase